MSSPPNKKEFIRPESDVLPSLVLEEECLMQETVKDESVNNLKEKVFELENSIVKLNIDQEKVFGEKEKQLGDLNK